MEQQNWFKLLWVTFMLILATGTADPTCQTFGVRDIVCYAGKSDYDLRRGLVSDNNRTTGITLRACRITDIEMESFKALPSLEYLDLSVNSLTKLKLGVLDDSFRLKFLNLSFNSLTEFPLGLFDQMPNLEILDLNRNQIDTIQQGVLAPLTKLRHLDLSGNMLAGRQLTSYIFEHNNHIQFMDFSRNDMSGTPDNLLQAFQAIDFLNLDRSFLNEVPSFATKPNLKSMKHLMLSTNQITKIDRPNMFVNLDNLEIINLAENAIESINANVFQPLKKLKMIVLRNNKLKSIPDSLFQNMPKLVNLYLAHNLLEFIPVNAFRGSGIKNLNIGGNKFTYLTDNFCLELKNSGTHLKKFYFGDNPWQCACLLDTLSEVRRMGIEYNNDKYNGEEKVCVANNFNCERQTTANDINQELFAELVDS